MLTLLAFTLLSPGATVSEPVRTHSPWECGGHCDHAAGAPEAIQAKVAEAWHSIEPDPKHLRDIQADIELGQKVAAEIDKELKPSDNPEHQERVERIGQELARIANLSTVNVTYGDQRLNPFPYRFRVFKDKDVNAFSLPGGFIYITDSLVEFCESDHELAGVIGHEIAHAAFRHYRAMQRDTQRLNNIVLPATILGILVGGSAAPNIAMGGMLTTQAFQSSWSQDAERSADYGGVQYMILSERWNPVGMLTFIERLGKRQRLMNSIDWGIYRTHPPSRERAIAITAHLEQKAIPIRRSKVTTSYRTLAVPAEKGIEIQFGGKTLLTLYGPDAAARAEQAARLANETFDQVPQPFQITSNGFGQILFNGNPILTITDDEVRATKTELTELTANALREYRGAAFAVQYGTADSR